MIAPSASDFVSSKSWLRSMSEAVPIPSQRGHIPPVTENVFFSAFAPAFSTVIDPAPWTDGVLNE